MNSMQAMVREFHLANGQPAPVMPEMLPEDRKDLRVKLIREELKELVDDGLDKNDIKETYDAALDILYVTFGLLVEMGLDAQPGFEAVHASNMSKLGADGKPIISRGEELDGLPAGKVLRGPNYFKPDLEREIRMQQATVATMQALGFEDDAFLYDKLPGDSSHYSHNVVLVQTGTFGERHICTKCQAASDTDPYALTQPCAKANDASAG